MIVIQRSNTPTGTATPKGVQFLNLGHVTNPNGHVAKILKVTSPDNGGKPDNYGNPYVVFFEYGGQKYSKGFKPSSDNLASLASLFGNDESTWKNKLVLIGKQVDEDGGRLTFSAVPKGTK